MSSSSRVIKLARLADGVRIIPAGAEPPFGRLVGPESGPAAAAEGGDAAEPGRNPADAAFEAGFQAGFEAGLAEGRRAAEAEAAAATEAAARRLSELAASARLDHRRILRAAEEQLLILALAAAEKVLARKLEEADRKLTADFVAEALEEAQAALESPEAVVVRVNPRDFEFVLKLTQELSLTAAARVIADPRVEAGGCVVETSAAVIDSTPTERLRQVARLFRQAHELEHRP